jgi:hypothetical protein
LKRYQVREGLGRFARLKLLIQRLRQSSDDTGYAYYAANCRGVPYDRQVCTSAYWRRAYAFYRRIHVERGVSMICQAVGFSPRGLARWITAHLFWRTISGRARRLAKTPIPAYAL